MRILAALLGMLVAFQPIALTSPQCTIAGLMTGRGVCCCAEPEEPSCCSTPEERESSQDVSIEAEKSVCACEAEVPAPLTAIPHEAGARGKDCGSPSMTSWIDLGAQMYGLAPVPSTASPPLPFRVVTPALRARGLSAVTCVARC